MLISMTGIKKLKINHSYYFDTLNELIHKLVSIQRVYCMIIRLDNKNKNERLSHQFISINF